MGDNSLITQRQLQSDLENFYNTKVYPYLNGSANLGFTPIGTVISVMSNEAPNNYLVCDGTAYNISEYSDLANFFEEQFGSKNFFGGDGTTTFAVPDLRGEFLRGTGTNSHTNPFTERTEGSGSSVGVHQQATAHRFYQVEFDNGVFGFTDAPGNAGYPDGSKVSGKMKYSTAFTNETPEPPVGGDYPRYYTSRPTNTSVLYCIAYKNIYFQQMHDYSTDDHVVGTWIDGKPIYEKTIVTTMPTITTDTSMAERLVNITDANIEKYIFGFGRINNQMNIERTWLSGNTVYFSLFSYLNNDNFVIQCNRISLSELPVILTIQYTKTTD